MPPSRNPSNRPSMVGRQAGSVGRANRPRLSVLPVVRGAVRAGVREGLSAGEIERQVLGAFRSERPATVRRLIGEETRRQSVVDQLMSMDRRRNVDLRELVGCPGHLGGMRVGVSITFEDPDTGDNKTYSDSSVVRSFGRLSELLNDAIGRTVEAARGSGYEVGAIRSTMTRGETRYRIDFVECA